MTFSVLKFSYKIISRNVRFLLRWVAISKLYDVVLWCFMQLPSCLTFSRKKKLKLPRKSLAKIHICIESNRNQIVVTMHRLIWTWTNVRLDPNFGNYNLNLVWNNKIPKSFLCVCLHPQHFIKNIKDVILYFSDKIKHFDM